MPKQITLEITDEMLESLDRYLDSNRQTVVNSANAAESRRVHATAEEFFQHHFGTLMASVAQQFPSKAMEARLAARRQIDDQIMQVAKPSVVTTPAARLAVVAEGGGAQ